MTVKIYAMTCGWLTSDLSMMLAGTVGKISFPVPAYLIDHPRGRVLFDSGLTYSANMMLQEESDSCRIFSASTFVQEKTYVLGSNNWMLMLTRLTFWLIHIYILIIRVGMSCYRMPKSSFRNVSGKQDKSRS